MLIIGAGGHGKIVAEIFMLNNESEFTFIDEDDRKKSALGQDVVHVFPTNYSEAAAIGIGNNRIRHFISRRYPYQYQTLIHPKTQLSRFCKIGSGTVIVAGATINIDAKIGKHVIINTNASVGHDCIIDDFVHIAPNVALAGNVKVGEGSHIGIGSSVIQGINIGKWCTIGAGTVVINDIPDGALVYGNPGKIVRIVEQTDHLNLSHVY